MIGSPEIDSSLTCRFRCAVVLGLTSISRIASEGNTAHGAWWPFSSRKPADDAGPKANTGYNAPIRKLMKEAKAEEEKGDLDRAIALADRAARVSESTSKIVKPAPDVSPEATLKYANELRLKKTELSVKSKDATPSRGKLADAPTDARSSVAKETPPRSKKLVVAKDAPKTPDRKVAAKKPVSPAAVAAVEPKATQRSEKETGKAKAKGKPVTAAAPEQEPEIANVGPAVAPTTPPNTFGPLPNDSFDHEVPAANVATNRQLKAPVRLTDSTDQADDWASQPVAAAEADKVVTTTSFDDDDHPQVTPMPTSSVSDRGSKAIAGTDSAPLKLRPQYASSALAETLSPPGTMKPLADFPGEPTITPMVTASHADNSLPRPKRVIPEPGRITPVAAEENPRPNVDTKIGFSDDFEPPTNADSGEKPANVASQEIPPAYGINDPESWSDTRAPNALGNSSGDKIKDLKNRLESASLEPGAVAPGVKSGRQEELISQDAESAKSAILRLRKKRQSFRGLPASEAAGTPAASVRRQVTGHTAIVQWRPAKQESATPPCDPQLASKPVRLPADLRQSLRDNSASTFEDPANSGFNSGSSMMAPLPPPELAIEQTSFDTSTESSSHRRQTQLDHDSNRVPEDLILSGMVPSVAAFSDSEDLDGSLLTSASNSPENTAESTTPTSASGPIERLARLFGIPASTMLGAVGLTAFIAGLWIVRATVRSK